MPENEDDPKELRRQIDSLRSAFEKSEIQREADKRVQEAEMSAMTSRLDKGFAENKEAMARSEASNKEALAQNREAIEKLRTDMYKGIVFAVAAVAAVMALFEYVLGAS